MWATPRARSASAPHRVSAAGGLRGSLWGDGEGDELFVPAGSGRQAGVIVGSVLGSLLLLSLLGLLIGALMCRYRRKECQRSCSECR